MEISGDPGGGPATDGSGPNVGGTSSTTGAAPSQSTDASLPGSVESNKGSKESILRPRPPWEYHQPNANPGDYKQHRNYEGFGNFGGPVMGHPVQQGTWASPGHNFTQMEWTPQSAASAESF